MGYRLELVRYLKMVRTNADFESACNRMMTEEKFFVSRLTYHGCDKGKLALGTSFPSTIVHLRLRDFLGESIICQKGAFCAGPTPSILEWFVWRILTCGLKEELY